MNFDRLNNRIDRDMAKTRNVKAEKAYVNRSKMEPIGIYLLPIVETQSTTIRCIFCGHPVIDIINKIIYISAYPQTSVQRVVYDTIHCKRCGQRYTKLL